MKALVPTRLDDFHDWAIWIAAVLTALATITYLLWSKHSPFRKVVMFIWRRLIGEPFGKAMRGYLTDVMKPELQNLNDKIDNVAEDLATHRVEFTELAELNSAQHEETAGKIDAANEKIDELGKHILANPGLPALTSGPIPITPRRGPGR